MNNLIRPKKYIKKIVPRTDKRNSHATSIIQKNNYSNSENNSSKNEDRKL